MALVPIHLKPGIDTQATPTLNEGGWSESENIRFFQGLPQKMGGFVRFCKATDDAGIPRALQAWTALSGVSYLAIACTERLNIFGADAVSDITPDTNPQFLTIDLSTTAGSQTVVFNNLGTPAVGFWIQVRDPISVGGIVLYGSYGVISVSGSTFSIIAPIEAASTVANGGVARSFTTVAGSPTVSVVLPAHGLFRGEAVNIGTPVVVGGLTLFGNYLASVISPDSYTITARSPATTAATVIENNNTIRMSYWNTPPGASAVLSAKTWSLANWGEFLMACPEGGPVFVWMPAMGVAVPAANITTAPQSNRAIFVATQEQILFCLGTVNAMTDLVDLMLVAWSDAGDYTDFVPMASNQAGSFRLSAGSEILGGISVAGMNLIWTDLALYSAQYLQPPLVWGFQPIGFNCGLIGQHAFGTLSQTVFWMSQEQFYSVHESRPEVLPCPVWDRVFKNIDRANLSLVVCETNAFFNEVSWEVPQLDGTVTRARMQADSGEWDYTILPNGNFLPRTAWINQSVFGPPLAGDANGDVWQHEIGNDAGDEPLLWRLKSGVVQIAEGDEVTFVRQLIPDIKFTASGEPGPGVVELLVYFWGRPQDPPRIKGPFPITAQTRAVRPRGRGWGLQFEFRGNDLGSAPRLGDNRYRGHPDGKTG